MTSTTVVPPSTVDPVAQHQVVETKPGPGLLGLSHLGFTVRDLPAAQRFWSSVMSFETLFEGDEYFMFVDRSAMLAIVITDQQGQAEGSFDERHVGLDHLALAVADLATLHQWEQRLTDLNVPHDSITTSDTGIHLNLRAPDNFPVELFVLTTEGAAGLGLTPGAQPVAGTHGLGS